MLFSLTSWFEESIKVALLKSGESHVHILPLRCMQELNELVALSRTITPQHKVLTSNW